jgi:hypothetical protein
MKLSKMIFDYWKYHMECPTYIIEKWDNYDPGNEGLSYYDGYNATFWYMLNVHWYRMNNKLFARTDNKEPFDPYLRDFHEEYLEENGYI